MRGWWMVATGLLSGAALGAAPVVERTVAGSAPIAAAVSVPANARIVYVSGTVPDVAKADAPDGSVERFGDTETQTRSILAKIEGVLKAQGMGLGDVVMMRVFLVAPPGAKAMDFAGMMRGYSAFFGTAAQPNKPARSTVEVAGLVAPGWLAEIEVTAARP
jgi:enamine deaminase RidA (YjgF/YER057c/UK114 family)